MAPKQVSKKRAGRSHTWDLFTKLDRRYAKCNLCNRRLRWTSCGGFSMYSNLSRHYALKHSRENQKTHLAVDQQINKKTEQQSSTLFRVSNAVEQEKLQVDFKETTKNLKENLSIDLNTYKDTLPREASVEKCLQKSLELPSISHNDNSDSDEDSEMDVEYSIDTDDFSEDEVMLYSSKHTAKGNHEKKRSRYFWQYNMQSKGPKGPKLKLAGKYCDVHDVKSAEDPIFSNNCPIDAVKHSGKARQGDGNDLTPNPKKLHDIGKELDKIYQVIKGLVPVIMSVNAKKKCRKEKNKFYSRVCRLKKKAQHEANKLKLFGLQEEQKHLLMLTKEVKKLIKGRILHVNRNKPQPIVAAIEALQMNKAVANVAGCSDDFVIDVLKHVASGDENGGLMVTPVYED